MARELNDWHRYFLWEFVEDYKDGLMPRRELLKRAVYLTGGVASAASVLALMGCGGSAAPSATPSSPSPASAPASAKPVASAAASTPASAQTFGSAAASAKPAASAAAPPAPTPTGPRSPVTVPVNDPAVQTRDVTLPGAGGLQLLGYEAKPKSATGSLPLVLVASMNVGLEDHIKDVTRRYAKEGYLAYALDPLSRQGGTAKVDRAAVGALMSQVGPNGYADDYKAALDFYSKQQGVRMDRIGMTGFCIGGSITYRTIEVIPQIIAASPYYGSVPPLEDVPKIKAAVWGVYSADPNDSANKDQDKLDAAMKAANVAHEFKTYPGTMHAFHDDTGPRYVQDQAVAAWKDTLAWFKKYLLA